MDFLQENLSLLYKTSGWTYGIIADKLRAGVPEKEQFSKDQIRSYAQGLTPPKPHFKNVFAKFLGVDVKDVEERKLTQDEMNEIVKTISDAGQHMIANQYEMIAQQRVILSLLASVKKPVKTPISDSVRTTLQMMVEDETEKVWAEKRQKLQ